MNPLVETEVVGEEMPNDEEDEDVEVGPPLPETLTVEDGTAAGDEASR